MKENDNVLAFLEELSADEQAQVQLLEHMVSLQDGLIRSAIQAAAERGIVLTPDDFFESAKDGTMAGASDDDGADDETNDEAELKSVLNALMSLCIGCEGRRGRKTDVLSPVGERDPAPSTQE